MRMFLCSWRAHIKWNIFKRKEIKLCYIYWKWFHFSSPLLALNPFSFERCIRCGFPNGIKMAVRRTYVCAICLAPQWLFLVKSIERRRITRDPLYASLSLTRCQKLMILRCCNSAKTVHLIYFFFLCPFVRSSSLSLFSLSATFSCTSQREYSIKALINTNGSNVLLCYAEGNWSVHWVLAQLLCAGHGMARRRISKWEVEKMLIK